MNAPLWRVFCPGTVAGPKHLQVSLDGTTWVDVPAVVSVELHVGLGALPRVVITANAFEGLPIVTATEAA